MRKTLFALTLLTLITVSQAGVTSEPGDTPATTADGLELVPGTEDVQQVWMLPGADLSKYRRVYLVEPAVAFEKNWLKDQNRGHPTLHVKPSDMEAIELEIRALFMEVFTEELLASGYTFSEVRDHDVMIIKPAILELSVNAPDIQVPGQVDVLTSSAGSMTLYMELYDSVSEQLLVKAVDPATDPDIGNVQLQKKVANRAAFKRMMKPWAQALARGFATPGAD
jgi:hypothetical protein